MIVVGQDFVKDGDLVEAVLGADAEAEGGTAGMRRIVDFAISHARLTLAILVFLLVAGALSYISDPEGGEPGRHDPDHLRPAFRCAASRRRTPSVCWSGRWRRRSSRSATSRRCGRPASRAAATCSSSSRPASIPTWRSQDVRAKVDDAKRELPADADEPSVHEVNLSLFPVIVVTLAGDLSERTLGTIARQAQDAIEQVPGVLSADLQGTRDEVVEIIAEPMLLKSYGVSLDQFAFAAAQGNSLVAAGALEGAAGPLRASRCRR